MQFSKNETIEFYDTIDNYCYEAVVESLKLIGLSLDYDDIWDIAKCGASAIIEHMEENGIDIPEELESF